jgi:hypothetical protein
MMINNFLAGFLLDSRCYMARRPIRRLIRNKARKMKKRILAIPAAADAISPNPNSAARSAMTGFPTQARSRQTADGAAE